MRIRQQAHTIYQTQYHIVWSTKYRRKILKEYVKGTVIESLYKVQRRFPDWYFHNINTDQDHIHLLMEIPPKYAVSDVVRELKMCTSAQLRKRYGFIDKIYKDSGIWSTGYFVSTVGLNEAQIKRYIDMQGQQDLGVDVSDVFS